MCPEQPQGAQLTAASELQGVARTHGGAPLAREARSPSPEIRTGSASGNLREPQSTSQNLRENQMNYQLYNYSNYYFFDKWITVL